MSEPDLVRCPDCQVKLRLPALTSAPKKVRCPKCKAVFSPAHFRQPILDEAILPGTPSRKALSAVKTENEQKSAREQLHSVEAFQSGAAKYAEELAEIERLQKAQASWGNALLILGVSAVLFFTAGAASWSLRMALLMIPVLFFHEMGHFLAMIAFKYRNVKMFFIPFLGAAVSGRHYNVPAWKKAVVSLLGPVPGIFLGAILGIVGIAFHLDLLLEIAVLMLILNGFNLLPLLPFDGGWVLHAILFSRHHLLDCAFRFLAACLLVGGGFLTDSRIFIFIGVSMFIALPLSYRVAKIASRLRNKVAASSPDNQTIPIDTACFILDELKSDLPKNANAKTRARCTLQVFESINTRPPGWLATFGLATVYAGSLVAALVMAVIFVIAQQGDLRGFIAQAAAMPKHPVDPAAIAGWRGADMAEDKPWAPLTISATFADPQAAATAFQELTRELPTRSTARLFGQTVLIELPADDGQARTDWVKKLESRTAEVSVHGRDFQVPLTIVCIAPNAGAAADIVAEASAYFNMPPDTLLISPWSSDKKLTEEQRKARKTYQRLQRGEDPNFRGREFQEKMKAIVQAQRRGDKQELKLLLEKQRLQAKEAESRFVQKIRDEGADAVDLKIVDLFAERPQLNELREDFEGDNERLTKPFKEWHRQLGERMGQLPLLNDQASPGADRFSCTGGFAVQTGLLLRLNVSFVRPAEGAPALFAWLRERKCIDFKYDFEMPGGGMPFLPGDELD